MTESHNLKLVSIDGGIGSGKSTLIEKLREKYKNNSNIIFLKEPVDEWENIKDENGITILENFYKNPSKYGFSFQIMAFISRLKIMKEAVETNPNAIFISERSLFTDRFVFAKMLFDSGNIELINYTIYLSWFNTFSKDFKVNKVIYVNTEPHVCYERIEKRSRTGESNIPLDYLHNVVITFKDGNQWNVIIKKRDREVMKGNLPKELTELFNNYEKNIANVDFQLDIPQMKKDVEKSTKKFLRGKK